MANTIFNKQRMANIYPTLLNFYSVIFISSLRILSLSLEEKNTQSVIIRILYIILFSAIIFFIVKPRRDSCQQGLSDF